MMFAPDQSEGLREIRKKMADLIQFLLECRIFVA